MFRHSRKSSNVSYSSAKPKAKSISTNQNLAEDTLLHWYRSHHSGLHSADGVIYTEESENEYLIEDIRFQYKCTTILCNPYAKCYLRVKKIRFYRHFLQKTLEDVFRKLRWIDLPGGQHRVAVERNYIMNYIWLMAFLIGEVDNTNKDTSRHIRYRLEELLVQAENLGILVQKFFLPLQILAQSHALVEEMGDMLQLTKITRPKAEKKIFRLGIKPDTTILCGNKITDFSKLLIYVRKDCQVWARFKTLGESDKVDIVTKGLQEITDNLKDLKGLIKKPLRAIEAGGRQFDLLLPSFVPHVQQMRNELNTIITHYYDSKTEADDRVILESLLSEVVSHYEYVLKYGELLVEEIWDIILMTRLSYHFIRESPQHSISTVSYEAVLISKFRKGKIKKFLKPSHFTSVDFFKSDCPETLRKLPVVVYPANAELSLHLQGHRNTRNKSVPTTPAHQLSIKKKVSSPRNALVPQDIPYYSEQPTKLMFVSDED